MQGMQIQSVAQEDALEKEITTLCSIPAWEIPWTEEHTHIDEVPVQHLAVLFTSLFPY